MDFPRHLAMIMDGNRRWARTQGLPVLMGHKKGAENLGRMVDACIERAIPYLTVYAFSSENWGRSKTEVAGLMTLMQHYIAQEREIFLKKGVQLRIIGDRTRLPQTLQYDLADIERASSSNARLTLQIALSYGGRDEILRAARVLAEKSKQDLISPHDIDEHLFQQHLDTQGIPDPDLLIRTGGEKRISNYLLWQMAYTEMIFTDTYWPVFHAHHLDDALAQYQKRERRFGQAA